MALTEKRVIAAGMVVCADDSGEVVCLDEGCFFDVVVELVTRFCVVAIQLSLSELMGSEVRRRATKSVGQLYMVVSTVVVEQVFQLQGVGGAP